jgi:small-conductance mechanosensitive channel
VFRLLALSLFLAVAASGPVAFAQIAEPPTDADPIAAPPTDADQNAAQETAPVADSPPAAPPPTIDIATPVTAWNEQLADIEARLQEEPTTRSEIDTARTDLEALRKQIQTYIAEQRPLLPQLEARLSSLGEPPAEANTPELKAVADQRTELQNTIAALRGALQASDEAIVRIEGLTRQAGALRRDLFEKQLLERSPSPVSPELWRYIGQDATIAWNRLYLFQSHLWDTLISAPAFIYILLAAIALAAAITFLVNRHIEVLRQWTAEEPPSDLHRLQTAGRVILLRLLPAAAACIFFYGGIYQAGLMTPTNGIVILSAISAIIIVVMVQAVVKTAFAIQHPQWHLIALGRRAARTLYYHLMILAAVYGIDSFVSEMIRLSAMPVSVSIVQSVISSALIAGLVISILRIKRRDLSAPGQPLRPIGPAYMRIPLWIAALVIIAATLFGYVALARFITGQLIVTSTILIVTYLLIYWASAYGQTLSDEQSMLGESIQRRFGLERRRAEQLALPLTLLMKAVIIAAAIPFILLLWGFDWFEIGSWLRQALFGFDVGGVRVSIFSIVAALLVFLVAFAVARLFQAWLDRSILERAGVDQGVRDSVRTGVGYLGIAIAAVISVSYLGLDFSSLAIVAGALSVGIGFGLQSIVNNFVSGLILLAERPIKAGDWIIAGGHEGIVKKISVRSTEIETFDRANVIVPNSLLISETVKNWTLHNNTGRVTIPIGVHYDSDPELVQSILLEVAKEHSQVMSNPAPFVYFENFADNALNFILYVYLSNINSSLSVRTSLRIEILKAFRKHGVEIPYPQRDIHLSEVEWLKDVLSGKTRANGKPARSPGTLAPVPSPRSGEDRGELG